MFPSKFLKEENLQLGNKDIEGKALFDNQQAKKPSIDTVPNQTFSLQRINNEEANKNELPALGLPQNPIKLGFDSKIPQNNQQALFQHQIPTFLNNKQSDLNSTQMFGQNSQ